MIQTYDITYEGILVGTAEVERYGLYHSFSCRCQIPDDGLYRIHVICEENREDLGICVPMGTLFGTDKKIPSKRIGDKQLCFELVTRDWKPVTPLLREEEPPVLPEIPETPEEELFIPVTEEAPFEYLDRLESAVMETRGDETGIVLRQ